MRLSVEPEKCCGSGMCVLAAPDVFDQSDVDGTVVLLVEHPDAEHEAAAREAVSACPAQAIEIS